MEIIIICLTVVVIILIFKVFLLQDQLNTLQEESNNKISLIENTLRAQNKAVLLFSTRLSSNLEQSFMQIYNALNQYLSYDGSYDVMTYSHEEEALNFILDKIQESGIESLTQKEIQILKELSK